MKLMLLAATALIAAPVMAQTSGSTGTSSPTTAGAQGSATDQTTTPAPTDQTATPAPADQTATPAPTDPTATPPATDAATPAGGYQPSTPALTGTATPGVQPIFRPAPTPDQAYPAPAPKAEYPVCKKGQYDGCRQVEGHSAGKAKRRARR